MGKDHESAVLVYQESGCANLEDGEDQARCEDASGQSCVQGGEGTNALLPSSLRSRCLASSFRTMMPERKKTGSASAHIPSQRRHAQCFAPNSICTFDPLERNALKSPGCVVWSIQSGDGPSTALSSSLRWSIAFGNLR